MSAKLKLAPGMKPIRLIGGKKNKEGGKNKGRGTEEIQSPDGKKISCHVDRTGE